jgi:hypothetical protein
MNLSVHTLEHFVRQNYVLHEAQREKGIEGSECIDLSLTYIIKLDLGCFSLCPNELENQGHCV